MATMEQTYETPVTVEEGYEKAHLLIFNQVHKFRRAYGGEFEDLLGEAHELFLKGHHQYRAGVTNTGRVLDHDYATQIRRWVWFGLFDTMRSRLERSRRAPMVPLDGHDKAVSVTFCMDEFVEELSWRGRKIARLVLDPPPELLKTIQEKGGTARNYRSTVRAHLRAKGWDNTWINEGFEEIKRVLG